MVQAVGPIRRDIEIENRVSFAVFERLLRQADLSDPLPKHRRFNGDIDKFFKPAVTDLHEPLA